MKEYPSIPGASGQQFREIEKALIFDKLDGSSMRSEWSRKRGWYKHGKRHGLVDASNANLVVVPDLFAAQLSEPLAKLATDNRWQSLIVFYEFWGVKSIAGLHEIHDPKFLTVFDAAVDKRGIVGPGEFLKLFEGAVPTPRYLGTTHWTRGYIELVRLGQVEGITFEGVVAKAGTGHNIVRAKAKTQRWMDLVLQLHGVEQGTKIINS